MTGPTSKVSARAVTDPRQRETPIGGVGRARRSSASKTALPPTRGKKTYSLSDFKRFCRTLVLDNGKRFILQPFQLTILKEHFEGIIETVVILPKKNGKTTLLAALALYHLKQVPGAMVVIGASSRDQATFIFDQAVGLIERSGLEDTFDIKGGYRHIRFRAEPSSKMRVIASDARTADGIIPTLALVDELHRHKTADLYGVFRDGLEGKDGQMVTISTAGSNLDSPLGELRTRAHQLETFRRLEGKKYNYAYDVEGGFCLHEWCLGPADDPEDIATVKLANPASWITAAKLKRRRLSPGMSPARWMRFACCIWTEAEDPWLEPKVWDALKAAVTIEDSAEVYVSVKVRGATAAIVVTCKRPEWLDVESVIWEEPVSGEVIEANVRELCSRFTVKNVLYDPWTFKRSAELLESEGLPMLDFPNSLERMSQASSSLQRMIEAKQLRHSGDMVLRSHVLAGTWKESERGRRLVEDPTSRHPIDALIALASAVHVAGAPQKTGEVMVAWR